VLREPRVRHRRADILVPEVFLHDSQVPAVSLQQFDAARMAEGMGGKLGDPARRPMSLISFQTR
jgi:hypothetical protein